MALLASVYQAIEDALSECFKLHNQLDSFIRRNGVSDDCLQSYRSTAEARAKAGGRYEKAPKRFVVQELIKAVERNDQLAAVFVDNLIKGNFPDATPNALAAIETLKKIRDQNKRDREEEKISKKRELEEIQDVNELKKTKKYLNKEQKREELYQNFLSLMSCEDAQKRGFLFETFLNEFFSFFEMNPRGPFKNTGEQIDGSFVWKLQTYMLEAKWVKEPVGGSAFSTLMYKIEGKTVDTRGLFVSVNGYSQDAIKGLSTKGALKFVCIDGAHIVRALSSGHTFQQVLETVWRHADETGEALLPVSRFKN